MKPYVRGVVTITTTDAKTGEIIDQYGPADNMVVDIGVATMWKRVSTLDETNQHQLQTLHLGDDLGTDPRWNIFNPEPPARAFNQTTQNVTHVIDPLKIEFDYPIDEILRVKCYLDGTTFMDDYFPGEVDYRFTSMTLRFNSGEVFAYKRFPIRSISRHVHVTFDWRFKIVNSEEWCAIPEEGTP